jgi:hypothetical protein
MKTMSNISLSLFAASITALVTTHTRGDQFEGSFTPLLDNHDDIINLAKDGLEQIKNFSLKVSKSDASHYKAVLGYGSDTVTIPTRRIGNRLVNSPNPTDMGGWTVPDLIILSDGTNRAFVMLGQDAPDDISCGIGVWSDYKGKVTVNDFVGTWKIDSYGDTNLLNTKDGFEHQVATGEIRKIDSNHIQVMTPGGSPLSLRVSGNEASLESPPVNTATARYHTFRMITDGQRMVFDVVATELDDSTDVSATIGLGVKQGPDISVQQPAGTQLVDGSAKKSFGTQSVGSAGIAKTFTIKNVGAANLTRLAITKTGSHNKDFSVSALAATTLAPGKATTFKVTFTPTATGTRNAAIHIKSNDADEKVFDIKLSGQGAK